jgi:hypothetical protein
LPGYLTKPHEVQYGQRRSLILGQSLFHEVDEAYINSFLTTTFTGSRSITSEPEMAGPATVAHIRAVSGQQGGVPRLDTRGYVCS